MLCAGLLAAPMSVSPASATCTEQVSLRPTATAMVLQFRLNLRQCGSRSAVGSLKVALTLRREKGLGGFERSRAFRCAPLTDCIGQVSIRHPIVEAANYRADYTYQNTGSKVVAGAGVITQSCTQAGDKARICY